MSDLQERARDVLPALLVGSGLKQVVQAVITFSAGFSRLYWSGVD